MFKKLLLSLTIVATLLSGTASFADSSDPTSTYQANPHQIDFNSSEHQLMMGAGLGISITTYAVLGETTDWKPSTKYIASTLITLALATGVEATRGFNEGRFKSAALGAGLGGFIIPFTFDF